MSQAAGTTSTAVTTPPAASTTVINTGIPGIGAIDYANPAEIALWAGIAGSIVFAPGVWKVIAPLGILFLRYELSKIEI